MARLLSAAVFRRVLSSAVRSCTPPPRASSLRPLVSAVGCVAFVPVLGGGTARCFSTRPTASSLNDPSPNWSNRPPKETILLDGCDFEHWLVVMEPPEGEPTRDEIIDSYIKTLAQVVGSEDEARMKIYSVSTRHYFAFGALVSEELSYKIKALPRVRWVLPDSYLDVKNKDYGGEPFIDGKAVPYDPKYHEEWVRNNARANERSRRNDRPRNFDRSRNFERRRENMQNFQNRASPPMPNQVPPPIQPPVTPQAYPGQQQSSTVPTYSHQGTGQPGYGLTPASQSGYASQSPAGGGYGQTAPLSQPSYVQQPQAPNTSARPVYGQAQRPPPSQGYVQPAPAQPGYTQPPPAQSCYVQQDPAHYRSPSGFASAPQAGYGQQQSYGGMPSQGQQGYTQPYGEPHASGSSAGYSQLPAYSSDVATGGNMPGSYESSAKQGVPSGVTKTPAQS